jgi:hypothetical protein
LPAIAGEIKYYSILEVLVQFAIEILERDRLRIREVLRSIERYEHEIQHGLERGSLNDQEAELQKAIVHLQSAEQGESPATDRQQLKAEIAALVNRLESYSRSQEVDNEFWDIVEAMRQLSAV